MNALDSFMLGLYLLDPTAWTEFALGAFAFGCLVASFCMNIDSPPVPDPDEDDDEIDHMLTEIEEGSYRRSEFR